ncbi:fumarylacetoacetase [Zhouia sp. PK063]|uniref:fumarylacetoacetase n=1 Tax=Zhouia sp. PK063 TaxID=3373602 RepID=UPI0037955210
MSLAANNPQKTSWITVPASSDFPIQNIPFGVFLTRDDIITIGTRIGDTAIDLGALHQLGYFKDIPLTDDIFLQDTLNDFISDGKKTWRLVRNRISELFDSNNTELQNNETHKKIILFSLDEIEMQLPVHIGDYTEFFTSKQNAINMGSIFKNPDNPLLANWQYMPLGCHGRSSTIVPSGIPIYRPKGQVFDKNLGRPKIKTSDFVDFELEMAFITTDSNVLGESIPVDEAEDYIFGMVLFNDWSARDIQKWEIDPLGPFLGKNFASSISPWIVTMDALAPFKTDGPEQNPEPLSYLKASKNTSYDVNLQVTLTPKDHDAAIISTTNFKEVYWSMAQQLAHHTINGCKINSGDFMATGTISGAANNSFGSMVELTWNKTKPLPLKNGVQRTAIEDFDTVTFTGFCQNENYRIGFGVLETQLLPPFQQKNK